ncbi:MAG: recombination regulator RecX [Actinomycetota bacterium]|nr:recombination regulator RecX [Actinomycetota bacterium]
MSTTGATKQDASDLEAAMSRAGRLLTLRQRTESEIVDRLGTAGFAPPVVAEAVARLKELRLLDDATFARSWVGERLRRKGSGPALLRAELIDRGVDEAVVEEVLAEALPDESLRATEVATKLLGRIGGLPLEKQVARLMGALARKGFSPEAVEEALRAVLPPEGWD